LSFPRYREYRETGVEWLGRIPSHWDIKPLKHVCSVMPSNVDKKVHEGDVAIRLCNYTDVYYNESITEDLEFMEATATFDQIERFTLRAGDVIVTKDSETADDIAVSAYVPADLTGVVCGYHLAILRPLSPCSGRFIKRVFDSTYAKDAVAVRSNGLTRVGLGAGALGGIQIPYPPSTEQEEIGRFLERETAKIDRLIGVQKDLIELLQEKRRVVISRAVTKGLDPNARLKPSGIEWIGDIPAHWTLGSLKRFWSVSDCKHVTAEFVDSGIPVASIREVKGYWVNLDEAKQTTDRYYEVLSEGGRDPRSGDLILTRNASVGDVAQVPANVGPFALGQDVCLLRRTDTAMSSDYLQHVLGSDCIRRQLERAMIGATFKRINVQAVRDLIVPWPPAHEQAEIGRLLLEQRAGDRLTLANVVEAIALLQERRTAIISAAVTGKIDVRAHPESEAA
jgi:type I restriction enzyme, S subunit